VELNFSPAPHSNSRVKANKGKCHGKDWRFSVKVLDLSRRDIQRAVSSRPEATMSLARATFSKETPQNPESSERQSSGLSPKITIIQKAL